MLKDGVNITAVESRALSRIGFLPRVVATSLFVIGVSGALVTQLSHPVPVVEFVLFAVPALMAMCSWRVGMKLSDDVLVVNSYLRTYRLALDELTGVGDGPYEGVWNRFSGTEGALNLGLRMLTAYKLNGTTIDMPATMCNRKTSRTIEEMVDRIVAMREESASH